ncbi:sulfatase, putative [Verrucomicrobiia bacterium DG1235]|nr:sulfatase, putative [Verrucomicrobiae bacterium DG1235]
MPLLPRLSLVCCLFVFVSFAAGKGRPNILFIMSDDHANAAVSAYDDTLIQTPNIDRLANEGMLFSRAFCTNSICGPARAVTLTGKYSHLNGFIVNESTSFDGGQQTYPKLLQAAGYETAVIGKWHLGSDPTGFDFWKILIGQGQYYDAPFLTAEGQVETEGYVTDVITDLAIDWLNTREDEKPFMLMYQHKAPHANFQPGPDYLNWREDETIPEPETLFDDYATRSPAAWDNEMRIDPTLELQYQGELNLKVPDGLRGHERSRWLYQFYIKNYLRCVKSVDDGVGRVFEQLEAMGELDNTIVIYTSDQGFFLGEHGYYDKRFMYEESLQIPLLVRYPKMIEAGSVRDEIVTNLDFAETMLDLAGVKVPSGMQGESLVPLLKGKKRKGWRDAMYYHFYEYPGYHYVKRHYGIRTERYKLIRFYHDIEAWELYDLDEDPQELNNLYGSDGYEKLTKRLKKRLDKIQSNFGDSPELADELVERYPHGSMPRWGRYQDFPWRD